MTRSTAWVLGASACLLAAGLVGCQKKPAETAAAPAASAAPAADNVQPQLTAGAVKTASANDLTIVGPNGPVSFQLSPATTIMVAHQGTVADIKPGSFIGTTNVPAADGVGRSTEVHIFPPGVEMGAGDRPMGPPSSSAPASRMTNGTVDTTGGAPGESASRMTNGSVGAASSAPAGGGLQINVSYPGGDRQIVVPAKTPVMVMSTGTPAMLKPGAQVLVGAVPGPNGTQQATFINLTPTP